MKIFDIMQSRDYPRLLDGLYIPLMPKFMPRKTLEYYAEYIERKRPNIPKDGIEFMLEAHRECPAKFDKLLLKDLTINQHLDFASFFGCTIINCKFNGSMLNCADFREVDLVHTSFFDAGLCSADLSYTTIRYCDFRRATLYKTKFEKAKILNTVGNGKQMVSLQLGDWTPVIIGNVMHIGCTAMTFEEWMSLDTLQLGRLHIKALEWNAKWRPLLLEYWKGIK